MGEVDQALVELVEGLLAGVVEGGFEVVEKLWKVVEQKTIIIEILETDSTSRRMNRQSKQRPMIIPILRQEHILHKPYYLPKMILLEHQYLKTVIDHGRLMAQHLVDTDLEDTVGGDVLLF